MHRWGNLIITFKHGLFDWYPALIWYLDGNAKLPNKIIRIINEPDNNIFVSIASLWELAIKLSRKEPPMDIKITFAEILTEVAEREFAELPILFEHLSVLKNLPHHHNDPFDRLLISQAITEDITLISIDKHFKAYPIKLLW